MVGILLAGGLGTRLLPLTEKTNKHLLMIHDRPMIAHGLWACAEAGLRDVVVVTTERDAPEFATRFASPGEYGLRSISIAMQAREAGIADALSAAETLAGPRPCIVLLGDNLFERGISGFVQRFAKQLAAGNRDNRPTRSCRLCLCEVAEPQRFGVADFGGAEDGSAAMDTTQTQLVGVIEKPVEPPSNLAVTGLYGFDAGVFALTRSVMPSARGEAEIAVVIAQYISRGACEYEVLSRNQGWWIDAGTHETLAEARRLVSLRDLLKPGNA